MNIRGFILSTRPKTLLASLSPVIIGISLALQSDISFINAVLVLLCAVLLQIGTNLVNDYFDSKDSIDRADRKGPLRAIHQNLITMNELKIWIVMIFSVAFLIGIYLSFNSGIEVFILGVTCIIFAFAYTAGPLPLSRFALGELAAFVFFGPIPVLGTKYILMGEIESHDLYTSFVPGFLAALLMSINNYRDRDTDLRVRKYTLASLFEKKYGLWISRLMYCFSMIALSYYLFIVFPLSLSLMIIFLILLISWKMFSPYLLNRKVDPNEYLQKTGILLLLATMVILSGQLYGL